ncbi:hypothetical protein GPJ56_003047 [Histomonas meleagridis]|uniref:uncharacterized protein n=1 Tax=Histomonas meleagridis TaxID=135588 RepID=UPI00355AC68A|nr:hypothetical protein GPJ56_003047 [Histomonas meleagridis]KAH0805179.1 hypothetical protein GO595_002124 [Histomonas meleagridis]
MPTPSEEVLEQLMSSDDNVRYHAANSFVAHSFIHPEKILEKLNDLNLVIFALCSSPEPEWGTTSAILFALANAVNAKPDMLQGIFIQLVEISKIITHTSITLPYAVESFYPHLSVLTQAIINNSNKYLNINKEIILSITDHSLVGYLSFSSLIQILVNKFDQVATIAEEFDAQSLMKIASPISILNPNISNFYLALWTKIIIKLIDNPFATKALRFNASALIKCMDTDESSKFLLDVIKASPREKYELLKVGNLVSERVISRLKKAQGTYGRSESTIQSTRAAKQNVSRYDVHKAQVSIIKNKTMSIRSKKWEENIELRLVEEASILFWSRSSNSLLKDGVAVQCSDIENLTLSKSEADKENVIKITIGSTKTSYLISFQNFVLASQWQNLIKQAKLTA